MGISQAVGVRNAKNRPFVLKKGISVLSDLADGGAVAGYPGDYYGQIYFVNNITGDSSFDGLSWDTPFDEVSTAITASEVFRQLPGGATTTNDYQRNIIYVQATGTAYSALTALPNHCDMIGIGADVRGHGTGIARISSETSADTVSAAAVRGLNMYNMQLTGLSSGYAMDLDLAFRCRFENCHFTNKTTGGVHILKGGGLVFRDCIIGAGDSVTCAIGLSTTGTGGASNFNNCTIENNLIWGGTTGVNIDTYSNNFTVFKNNFIYGGTTGIDDDCASSNLQNNVWYINNWVYGGSDAISIVQNDGYTTIGNRVNSTGTSAWEDA